MKNMQEDILDFWFKETQPQQWFQKNEEFDELVRERFLESYEMARKGHLDDWKQDADGCLALCLLLDQFPRNMFRGSPQSFASDGQALLIAKYAISKGFDQVLQPVKQRFIYLPFEHSESMTDQKRSLELFEKMKQEDPLSYEYALRHYKVIEEYGRFPHRNAILDRVSTPEEKEYLSKPGAGF
ncbi:MAG: hypothetical protein CL565_01710 [Alphaproteobacteria bacterium]|nr:hypothetical protein [Alphaproteobacteria bacterium]